MWFHKKNASLSFAGKTLAVFLITENSSNNNDLPQNRPMDTFGFVLSVTKALDETMKSCWLRRHILCFNYVATQIGFKC